MTKTALFESGAMVQNSVIAQQLQAGAHAFTVPMWHDLADDEADIANDDPPLIQRRRKSVPASRSSGRTFFTKAGAP
ncbi:hypothetical protein HML84_04815 [Alcanivorax sp. IO_7]|nr:hypothetical protein HML84_04815 [Alcanivorax sp. IO_7]